MKNWLITLGVALTAGAVAFAAFLRSTTIQSCGARPGRLGMSDGLNVTAGSLVFAVDVYASTYWNVTMVRSSIY